MTVTVAILNTAQFSQGCVGKLGMWLQCELYGPYFKDVNPVGNDRGSNGVQLLLAKDPIESNQLLADFHFISMQTPSTQPTQLLQQHPLSLINTGLRSASQISFPGLHDKHWADQLARFFYTEPSGKASC